MVSFSKFAESNSNGYTLIWINASADEVAGILEKQKDVVSYQRDCEVGAIVEDPQDGTPRHADGSYLQITARPDKRTSYLVQGAKATGCVLFRTLEWAQSEDCAWVQATAKQLAAKLGTLAISVAGSYECDVRIYDAAKLVKKLNGADLDKVERIFAENNIDIPDCTIAENPPRLFATGEVAGKLRTAHRMELKVT